MGLTRREVKASGVAQRIDRDMDLGAQAAPAASESLLLRIPPFVPALCWWARTMVESIITYSLSATCAKAQPFQGVWKVSLILLLLGINRPEVANDCIKNKQVDGEFTGSWTLMWLR